MELQPQELISGAVTTVAGVLSYLARHFLKTIERDQRQTLTAIGKLEGRLESLIDETKRNTVATAKMGAELSAVWRFIDGAHQRATDTNKDPTCLPG